MSKQWANPGRFGNRVANPSMTMVTAEKINVGTGLKEDVLLWSIFSVPTISFGSQLVLVKGTDLAWDGGFEQGCESLLKLAKDFQSVAREVLSNIRGEIKLELSDAIWILQKDHCYHHVTFSGADPKLSLRPVFSLNPKFAAGSIEAFKLMFPENGEFGVKALANFPVT